MFKLNIWRFALAVIFALALICGAGAQDPNPATAVTTPSAAVAVTVYTYDFPPFSTNGKGFSIGYIKGVLELVHGKPDLEVTVVDVGSIAAIISSVLAHESGPNSYCVGTAGKLSVLRVF
jgi:hypothetical protein